MEVYAELPIHIKEMIFQKVVKLTNIKKLKKITQVLPIDAVIHKGSTQKYDGFCELYSTKYTNWVIFLDLKENMIHLFSGATVVLEKRTYDRLQEENKYFTMKTDKDEYYGISRFSFCHANPDIQQRIFHVIDRLGMKDENIKSWFGVLRDGTRLYYREKEYEKLFKSVLNHNNFTKSLQIYVKNNKRLTPKQLGCILNTRNLNDKDLVYFNYLRRLDVL